MKYVITGGPHTGKTTLCQELAKAGYNTVPEVARQIIAEQKDLPKGILPWTDLRGFQHLVLERQMSLESKITTPSFIDRGVIDNIAYCWEGKASVPQEIYNAASKAKYTAVFLLDQLPNYNQDAERMESPEKAHQLHQLISRAYQVHGYKIINVPVLPPVERAQYVIKHVEENYGMRQSGSERGQMLWQNA